MKQNESKANLKNVFALCSLFLGVAMPTQWTQADGLATDYDSVPPLLSSSINTSQPKVLLILDTSGSMRWDIGGTGYNQNYAESRSVIARQAIAKLMDAYADNVDMGLMTFQPDPSGDYYRAGSSPNLYWESSNTFVPNTNYRQIRMDRGYLQVPIGGVDSTSTDTGVLARIAKLATKLSLNEVTQTAPDTGYYDLFKYDDSDYDNSSDRSNGRIIDTGGTPLAGALDTALNYYNGTMTSGTYDPAISASDLQWPQDNNQCSNSSYAILITDGLPSVSMESDRLRVGGNNYNWCSSSSSASNYCSDAVISDLTQEVRQKAEALLAAGVETFVIGFGTGSGATAYLDEIAKGGAGDESATAYSANNLSSLTIELNKIFNEIVNKSASGTGAAVVANRGNGLSADFQALYTPSRSKDDDTVTWVGTLHGFFIDENRLLREDTNQDGLLGDYVTDRIIEFEYDPNQKATLVNRMFATLDTANATSADEITIDTSSVLTSAIEDIKSIWNARDELAALSNVTTQRLYSALVDGSANGGRRIYTSVDGSTLQDFVAVDEAGFTNNINVELAGLGKIDADQQTVDDALAALDSNVADYLSGLGAITAAIQDALAKLSEQHGTLVSDLDAGTLTLSGAQAAEESAGLVQGSAQSTRDTAEGTLTAAVGAQTTAQQEFNDADTALNEEKQDVADAEIVVQEKQDIFDPADQALKDAIQAVQDLQTPWNTAKEDKDAADAAVITATKERDDAVIARDTAQGKLDAAQQAFDDVIADGFPPSSQIYLNAESDRDAALQERDDMQGILNTKQGVLNTALSTQTTETNEFNTIDGQLQTAVGDQSTAQGIYNTALGELNTAKSNLTTQEKEEAEAQKTYDEKYQALTDANQDVTDATTALNNAETALTAAKTAYDAAELTLEVARAYDFIKQIEAFVAAYATMLTSTDNVSLSLIENLGSTERFDLLGAIMDLFTGAPNTTVPVVPNADTDGLLQGLLDALGNIYASNGKGTVYVSDATTNSLYEYGSAYHNAKIELDASKSSTTLAQATAYINKRNYISFMDDNILGQTGDPDLSFSERNDVINWIRGQEVTGLRNRTIDFDGDGTKEVWRLADIVHSTPVVVGRPSELYYSRYGDDTYSNYMTEKFNRRQVVYVGSNDGMLHAFNAGFWSDSQRGYVTQLSGDSAVAHPLGAELWSFIPKAALPHLQFVADKDYTHMALMDGAPQAFDVNIFPDDDVHPGGWGTILVVTMRLGGGPFTVSVDEDGNNVRDGVAENTVIRPSVMVFDVTDPEDEPTLLAEISSPSLGFTLGKPALIKHRVASASGSWANPSVNRWLLVFGSGPTDLDTATSNQNASLFTFDLALDVLDWTETPINLEGNAFTGDFSSVDWDRDYIDDAVYFGVNSGGSAAPDGQLARLKLNSSGTGTTWLSNASIQSFMDIQRSIMGAPLPKSDVYGRRWVYFGTGRMLVNADGASTQQEYFAGVKEPIDSNFELTFGSVNTSELLDVSNIEVYASGLIENGPTGVNTTTGLTSRINESHAGWIRRLYDNSTNPSGRSDTKATTYLDAIAFSEYIPSSDVCTPEGTSNGWAVDSTNGVASAKYYLDSTEVTDPNNSGQTITKILPSLDLGAGKVGDMTNLPDGNLVLHDSTGRVRVIEPYQTTVSLRRQSWRQIFDIDF
ncbi:MAG: hypothetical protein CMK89_22455 [Pseudomonadales bacterium]|nr:hypothetical protein [Pseudomonadales bacterium]